VHYSLLRTDAPPEAWPVVMTVPITDPGEENWVLGENLMDFLCLGCHSGYFGLEGVSFKSERVEAIGEFGMPDAELDHWPEKLDLLRRLRKRFHLERWAQPLSRLDILQAKYRGHLIVPPWPDE
jgi:hypothetical protein